VEERVIGHQLLAANTVGPAAVGPKMAAVALAAHQYRDKATTEAPAVVLPVAAVAVLAPLAHQPQDQQVATVETDRRAVLQVPQ